MSSIKRDPEADVFKHQAMATWFELHLPGLESKFAKGVAVEAFLLLDRLESLLSRYREDSEVSIISRLQPGDVFLAEENVFSCLALALACSEATFGAFDPALGREMDRRRGQTSTENEGPRGKLLLDMDSCRIGCEGGPVPLDLGAVGKGFALDKIAEMLKEWGVEQAMLAGGGSSLRTLAALGDSDAPAWSVGMGDGSLLWLTSGAVGCSGIAVQGSHIIDPRTRQPAIGPERVWVVAPEAAEADAFSTAFMVLSRDEVFEVVEGHGALAVATQPKIGGPLEWLIPPIAEIHGAFIEAA